MKYCDRCDATYSDRISFCFKDGSALFARRSALDLPSLDGPLGSPPALTETDSESLLMCAQTTEEFLQVPIRRAGIEPVNPLIEPPPPAWNEPNLAPAPTDPIGSMSFDDASGFFNESPVSPDVVPAVPARPVKKTPKKRTKLPIGFLGGVGLVALAVGLVITLTSNNTADPDISLDEVLVAQPNVPIEAPTPVEATAPIADVVMDTAPLDDATEALPENVLDDEDLAIESEQEAPIISNTAPEQTTPVSKPKTIKKTRKTTKKRPRNVVKKKAVAAPVVTEDNPWGAADSTIIATSGSLSITSTPSGATIWIDQKKRGITPLRVDLSFNTYSVRAELAGHKTRNIVVPIKSSDPSPIPFSMQALPKIGKIQVSSQEHNGKSLTMDGSSRGTLPLQIREVEEGRHTFVVDGKSTTVNITFNENLTFALSL